jgi:hypothetical protein
MLVKNTEVEKTFCTFQGKTTGLTIGHTIKSKYFDSHPLSGKIDHAHVAEDPGGGHRVPVVLVRVVDEQP